MSIGLETLPVQGCGRTLSEAQFRWSYGKSDKRVNPEGAPPQGRDDGGPGQEARLDGTSASDKSPLVRLPNLEGVETLGQQIETALEQAILDGELAPGTRLNAEHLAEEFGTSRIPVREALRALSAGGWVEIRPRHAVYVSARRPEELQQLYEVRISLEAQSCRLAARRHTGEQAEKLLEVAHEGLRIDDPAAFTKVNSQFHGLIAQAAHNEVLDQILSRLRKRVQWYFAEAAPIRSRHSREEHLAIVQAIVTRDEDQAAALGEKHVGNTLAVLLDRLASS